MADLDIDLNEINADQMVEMLRAVPDDAQVADAVKLVGANNVMGRIFDEMGDRVIAERVDGVSAVVEFVVNDGDEDHNWTVTIDGGTAKAANEAATEPRCSIHTDIASFLRLVSGVASGPALFMAGKVKIHGDMMFAAGFNQYFEQPA